jgi:serine protease
MWPRHAPVGRPMSAILGLLLGAFLSCTPLVAVAVMEEQSAAAQPQNELIDGIIVRYRTKQSGAALSARARALRNVAAQSGINASYLRSGALGIHVYRLGEKKSVADVERLARQIEASDPNVEYAEPDRIMRATFTPNDPRYNEQWHYFAATGGINVPAAWDVSTGANVVVAVIDTGYRPHADLAANVLPGYDFISNALTANDGNGRDSDARDPGDWAQGGICPNGFPGPNRSSWHGTHVAGTIAARTNNSTGVAGVAFNAKVLPARVLGVCGGSTSDIADAIVWASGGNVTGVPANATPARVLNLSLGGGGQCSATSQNAINSARSRNAVVVVAAGNSNADAANFQPANCSGVITVAATSRDGGKASYSNFGATVEIAAPGGRTNTTANGVLSTLNAGATTPGADNYEFYQGTSMAAPHVSGVVALMLSRNQTLTANQCLSLLQSTARPFPGSCSQCGSGIVNAAAAVSAVSTPGAPGVPASLRVHDRRCNGTYVVTWNASSGQVDRYELYFDNDASFTSPGLHSSGTSLTRTFVVGGPGTVRYLRVKACNENGCSSYSNQIQLNGFSGCGQ